MSSLRLGMCRRRPQPSIVRIGVVDHDHHDVRLRRLVERSPRRSSGRARARGRPAARREGQGSRRSAASRFTSPKGSASSSHRPAGSGRPFGYHRDVSTSPTAPLIHARGLTKRFGDFTAVDAVDFDVQPGEAFGFLGPNGAGKTSTMRMIGCISPGDRGQPRGAGHGPGATTVRPSAADSASCPRPTRSTWS